MVNPNIDSQFRLFRKYWDSAAENRNLKEFQTAEQLRAKLVPQIGELIDDENKIDVSGLYELFAEFSFKYFLCLQEHNMDGRNVQDMVRQMAQKAIELNPTSFDGHYYLAVHYSWNQRTIHAGGGDNVVKGDEAAATVVFTAFNLFRKAVTLGATAASAGVARSNFAGSVRSLIQVYQHHMQQRPIDVFVYLDMTAKVFEMGDFCQDFGAGKLAHELFHSITAVDIETLDYSDVKEEFLEEIHDTVLEMHVLAESRL